ncbi:MAG: D-aminoacyl-tRNA deacylase [Acidobacteriota bacterium]|nr:D-aminoacyl-tRNA deacylase [Acidobacteriota bacterium]
MRALVQRVSEARVSVAGTITGEIGIGLCVFVGIKGDDTAADASALAGKVTRLRIFSDAEGKMNRSLSDVAGELLIVSQFTLYGDTRKGNRPSYSRAAKPELAQNLYETFINECKRVCPRVETGVFQANMDVRLINDGPVTLMCYSGE